MSLYRLCPSTLCPPTFNPPTVGTTTTSNISALTPQHSASQPPPSSPLQALALQLASPRRVQPLRKPAFSRGLARAGLFAILAECCRLGRSARWCHAWRSDIQCSRARMLRLMLASASGFDIKQALLARVAIGACTPIIQSIPLRGLVQPGLVAVATRSVVVVGAALSGATLGRVWWGRNALRLSTRQATSLEQGASILLGMLGWLLVGWWRWWLPCLCQACCEDPKFY